MDSYCHLKQSVDLYISGYSADVLTQRLLEISNGHLNMMPHFLPQRAVSAAVLSNRVLALLESWALLSPNRVNILLQLCRNFMDFPSNVAEIFNCYKARLGQASVIDYLSNELGSHWLDVGRRLPGLSGLTRDIDEDYTIRHTRQKIKQLLEHHFEENSSNAVSSLMDALAAEGLNRHRDHVMTLLQRFMVYD